MNNKELVQQLTIELEQVVNSVTQLEDLDEETLNMQPEQGKWSIAQIVEHLNTYNRYYLPLLSNALQQIRAERDVPSVKSGWLGSYFIKAMYSQVLTKEEVTNKMKAVKKHSPDMVGDAGSVLSEFLNAEHTLLRLVEEIGNKDLSRVKIPVTLSKYVKINAGDALRFLVAHQTRHMLQLRRAVSALSKHCHYKKAAISS